MQVVLNSNKTSLVQNTLTKNGNSVHSLAYSTSDSFPNISKKISEISPYVSFTGPPDSNSETFNIPRSNFWYLGRLQFKYSTTLASGESSQYIGFNIIRQIDFLCNGQPFFSATGEALKSMVMNSPADFQEYAYRYAMPLDQVKEDVVASGAGNFVSYVPLFGSWFQSREKALNCSELEQIQVVVSYKTFREAGLSIQMPGLITKLHTYKFLPDQETVNKINVQNLSSPLLECYNTITERQQLITSINTPQIFTSNIFYGVYKTHIFIAKTNTDGDTPVYGCPYVNIDSISLDIGGENFCTNFTRSMINYEQACNNIGNRKATTGVSISRNAGQCYTIDWSLLCDRDSNSGLASMANLNKPQYTIKLGGAAALTAGETLGSYWLFLVHEYWSILEVSPETKVIQVRASH